MITLPVNEWGHDMSVRFETLTSIPVGQVDAMFSARKRMFIDELKWDLPDYAGGAFEIDKYDTPKALYCIGAENGISRYSVRLLDRQDSMVKDLWPRFLEYVPEGAVEVSRFVTHGTKSLRFNRASIELFHYSLRMKGNRPDFFAVATEKMARAFSIALDWTPTQMLEIDAYPDLKLLLWLKD